MDDFCRLKGYRGMMGSLSGIPVGGWAALVLLIQLGFRPAGAVTPLRDPHPAVVEMQSR